jgi:hypothetical protein
MMVVGGDTPTGYTSSAEFAGSRLESVTPLSVPLAFHCMAPMDSLTVVVTGGYTTKPLKDVSRKTYFYNIVSKKWTEGPAMIGTRAEHGCSFITGKDGQPTTIVVGGNSKVRFVIC